MEKDVYESCRQREWLAALGSREAARSACGQRVQGSGCGVGGARDPWHMSLER